MEQDLFDDKPVLDLRHVRKTKKNAKKSNMKISRKAVLRVEEDLKTEYRKYVNSIKRRKLCKVKSFRVFANERMGKKSRRNSPKPTNQVKPVQSFFAAPAPVPVPVETQAVSPEPSSEPSPEPSSSEPSPEPSSSTQGEEPSSSESTKNEKNTTEEESNNSIVKTITDTLGLSSRKNIGGKKNKRKNNRSRK
jgi:hypothetical protein